MTTVYVIIVIALQMALTEFVMHVGIYTRCKQHKEGGDSDRGIAFKSHYLKY